ncbi:MAG: hypothetical protein ACYDEP_12085 [Acidimicrobiales bacterium]
MNLPFVQFILDVAMVITYWLTATTAPLAEHSPMLDIPAPTASAFPEAMLVFVAFVLYVLWDRVSKIMQSKEHYINAQSQKYDPGRRMVTVISVIIAGCIAALAGYLNQVCSGQRTWVIAIDVALVILLVAYRAAKELWRVYYINRKSDTLVAPTPILEAPASKAPDIIGRLESIERKLDELTLRSNGNQDSASFL